MSQVIGFQCPHCNAPLDINPEDAIFNCEACGQALLSDGSIFDNHYILSNSISKGNIQDIIKNFIKKKGKLRGIKKYKITSISPILLPFWGVAVSASTHYMGYRQYTETRTRTRRGSKGQTITTTEHITVYRHVENDINEKRLVVLIGRRGSSMYGYENAKEIIRRDFNKAVPFNHNQLVKTEKDFQYLSSEIAAEAANQLAKTVVFDDHRARAEKACTKVFDCATQITFEGVYFIHVPVWQVDYHFQGETYRVAISGNTGEIIIGEIPVTKIFRMIFLTLTFLLLIGGGTFSYFMGYSPVATSIAGVIVALLGLVTLGNVFKFMKVVG